MRNTFWVILTLLFVYLLMSCNQNEPRTIQVEPINPNGDSELALLMRDMVEEVKSIKRQIANKQPIKFSLDHEKIMTAHATEPEKANSPTYKTFAQQYLQIIKMLKNSTAENVDELYNGLIDNCLSCHQQLCPGPMVRIRKLK